MSESDWASEEAWKIAKMHRDSHAVHAALASAIATALRSAREAGFREAVERAAKVVLSHDVDLTAWARDPMHDDVMRRLFRVKAGTASFLLAQIKALTPGGNDG